MDIRQKTEEKVFRFLGQYHMVDPQDHIALGVSGGADSVCLLVVLLEYAKRMPLKLSAIHVNHGIRPEAAQDADYVEKLCGRYGIPFYLTEADVRGYAAREKCSQEDAGRRLRYEAFREIAGEIGANKIAVAHNCNDRAETMLFHLFRGSGLKGLCGIRPVRQEIIRPILCLQRTEIEAYLTAREVAWCTDRTNESDDYTRNRIRHHVLPYAEKELVQGCVGHMARTAELLAETDAYMQQQTQAARDSCVKGSEGGFELSVELFGKLHPAIQKRLLHLLAVELSVTGKDILAVHIAEVMSLFEKTGNRRVNLPMGISAARSYTKVWLGKNKEYASSPLRISLSREQLAEQDSFRVALGEEGILEFKLLSGEQYTEVPRNRYTKWFDYDKIEKSICVRHRETGDYLTIAGGKGQTVHKSLKDYMVTEKIPREERDRVPLLAEEGHVLWVIGGRISEYYKVDRGTGRILQVQLQKSCLSGETEDKHE